MAERAGVRAGDVVTALAGATLRSATELARALRVAGAASDVSLEIDRGGVRTTATVPVQGHPREALAGAAVVYDHVEVGGARLRTIVTRPDAAARYPAILFVQGLSCASIDFAGNEEAPSCRLVHGWTAHGFLTMRIEKHGVGDSEGQDAATADFASEVDAVRAALRSLAARDDVDPERIFVFGHSVGGRIAPQLVTERPVRGLLTYGAPVSRWFDVLALTTREQLGIRGVAAAEIEARVTREQHLLREGAAAELLDGRTVAYHRQHDAYDVVAAWRAVAVPVLVIIGALDWVVNEAEQRRIATLVKGPAEVLALESLDHAFTTHADLGHSLAAYGAGPFDERLVTATVAWLRRICG
jgi:hypothetical protein